MAGATTGAGVDAPMVHIGIVGMPQQRAPPHLGKWRAQAQGRHPTCQTSLTAQAHGF
jgi:hypothetical protein